MAFNPKKQLTNILLGSRKVMCSRMTVLNPATYVTKIHLRGVHQVDTRVRFKALWLILDTAQNM